MYIIGYIDTAAKRRVDEVKQRRDAGASVCLLLAHAYTLAEVQRDDSESLCQECCRPRVMCGCTLCRCPGKLDDRKVAKADWKQKCLRDLQQTNIGSNGCRRS